ncbi:hypothetical protein [Sulfurimonas sp. HSL-1716]|uniref:hypothetical protein n=1 Tax=Hydrocurvibacter sulfurireducens TaxID=3131937 RepID=UPI0031F757D5
MNLYKLVLSSIFLVLAFAGCDNKSNTSVAEVHWDRDTCTRCVMVISDRKNAVQVRNAQNGKTYMFDDLGCMAIWFENEKISWKDKAVIWVKDVDTGAWLNARKAFYDAGNLTPMGYGFSAHKTKESIKAGKKVFTFNEAVETILKTEK